MSGNTNWIVCRLCGGMSPKLYQRRVCAVCFSRQQADYHRRRKYGLSLEMFDVMKANQGMVCAICGDNPATDVDHCHLTGAVRAILCTTCNLTLGRMKEDPTRLRAAADYIEFHRARSVTA